jgi:hypothetical protein
VRSASLTSARIVICREVSWGIEYNRKEIMTYQKFFINRAAGTSADTLLALGWADLLRRALQTLGKPHAGIVICDTGPSFEVTLPVPVQEEELTGERKLPFLELLISAKQDERQAKKGRTLQDGFNYDKAREKQTQLIANLKQLPPALRRPEARFQKDPQLAAVLKDGPPSELPHYQAINMLKVPDTFNEIVLRWQSLSAPQQWLALHLLCLLFSQQVNDVEAAIRQWTSLAREQEITSKALITAVQVINPTTGKGSNSSKSNRLSVGGLESFWLLELLKFKGFMLATAPYVIKGSKDRKTYVILPAKIELGTLTAIMDQFREICWSSTAVKQDILASLRLTQVLVRHRREELRSAQGQKAWRPAPLISIAQGFDITSYKDMGSAHATINLATINVPNWFPDLSEFQQVDEAEELLQEHIRIIRRIEGHQGKEGSEELRLLQSYRDFLSGHDLQPFWRFAALYGGYLFRQREHEKDAKRWLPQLTKKGLDLFIMHQQPSEKRLSVIMQTPGFQHIASAIREATVRAQRRVSQENDNRYEIRYGLNQKLLGKAHSRNEFMTALGEFIALYNAETAREEEKLARRLTKRLETKDYRTYRLRYPVTTADMEQFGELLDSYPTELVATMLVAYGYARLESLKKEEAEALDENVADEFDARQGEDE